MEIRTVLYDIFKEKAESLVNEDLNSFVNTNTLPKNLKDEDVSENFKRVYSAIGSILAIGLGTLLFCYDALLIFVKGSLMLLGS